MESLEDLIAIDEIPTSDMLDSKLVLFAGLVFEEIP